MACRVAGSSARHDSDSLAYSLMWDRGRFQQASGPDGRSLSKKAALASFGQGDRCGWEADKFRRL